MSMSPCSDYNRVSRSRCGPELSFESILVPEDSNIYPIDRFMHKYLYLRDKTDPLVKV